MEEQHFNLEMELAILKINFNKNMETKFIKLAPDEVWPLLNILNEVCYGLVISNFDKKIGFEISVVVELMDCISIEENSAEPVLKLKAFELEILKRSFEEVFKQIEEWEFQTRIGITIQEAKEIENKLMN